MTSNAMLPPLILSCCCLVCAMNDTSISNIIISPPVHEAKALRQAPFLPKSSSHQPNLPLHPLQHSQKKTPQASSLPISAARATFFASGKKIS